MAAERLKRYKQRSCEQPRVTTKRPELSKYCREDEGHFFLTVIYVHLHRILM